MDELTSYLNDVALDCMHDEETGSSVEGSGWHALFRTQEGDGPLLEGHAGAILTEDTQGFKTSELYDTVEELDAAWKEVSND